MAKRQQTTEAEIINTLRAISRLQTRARRLRRQLKANAADLKAERKHLRALQAHLEERRPDVAPLRLFANAVGITPAKVEREPDPVKRDDLGDL